MALPARRSAPSPRLGPWFLRAPVGRPRPRPVRFVPRLRLWPAHDWDGRFLAPRAARAAGIWTCDL